MVLQQKHQHWLAICSQQESIDLTITQFSRENKLNTSTFYSWRKKVANYYDDKLPTAQTQQLVRHCQVNYRFSNYAIIFV